MGYCQVVTGETFYMYIQHVVWAHIHTGVKEFGLIVCRNVGFTLISLEVETALWLPQRTCGTMLTNLGNM